MSDTYQPVTIETAADELNRLHKNIEGSLRRTVSDAIRAGEILTQVKAKKGHGEFLPWIEANCSFAARTAQEYMGIYRHADKGASLADLQSARKEVARLESLEQQTERQKATQRVKEYRKTGVKPEGWRRGTDDKLLEEEEERDRRVEEAQARMAEAEKRREQEQRERKERLDGYEQEAEFLNKAAEAAISHFSKRAEFKGRIKLSQSGESDAFIDALMDYLDELEDDNRRIEACQNIIKVCRNIAAELQRA